MKKLSLFFVLVTALAAVVAMPAIAYAGGSVDLGNIIKGTQAGGTFRSGDRAYVKMADLDALYGDFSTQYANGKVECYFYSGSTELAASYDSSNKEFYYNIHPSRQGTDLLFGTHSINNENSFYNNESNSVHISASLSFTIDSSGLVTVLAESDGSSLTFKDIKVDGSRSVIPTSQVGEKSFGFTFWVNDPVSYSVGLHSLIGYLSDGTTCAPLNKIPVSIYEKATLKANMFETWKNYFILTPGNFNSATYGDLYIDYKKGKSGKWNIAYGPFSPNASGKIKSLKPASTYYVRAYYAKLVDGKYFFGPASKTVTIKTGPKKKPAIKSVSISGAAVKKVKVKGHYYWDNGTLKYSKGFTTYETTYKVTIKFKKKPGIAGIEVYAGGVTLPTFIKGNKKTYTTKFTVAGKAKGKKTVFKICTKGNKTYGAWSPYVTKKKVKIK